METNQITYRIWPHTLKRKAVGFTLVELMIVVAVVAILAAIAYPSYIEQVRRASRAEARSLLLENAQQLERFLTQNNTYVGFAIPGATAVSPRAATGDAIRYNISFSGLVTANTYLLQAVPAGAMTGDPCGTFTLNQWGQKGLENAEAGRTVEQCWQR